MKNNLWLKFTFIIILSLGFACRIYGCNWDQSQHLHPDERFMTMVASSVKMPPNLANYFSQKESTLNPYNHNFSFYVYGTFPILITRFLGELSGKTGYDEIFLVGRRLSVFFDLLTLILIYIITRLIFKKEIVSLWSMFFYATAVFPIQQAHFFTVDSFTVFFSTLSIFLLLLFLEKKKWFFIFLTGGFFGLTLANKTSIGVTLPLFILTIVFFQKISKKDLNSIKFFSQKILLILVFVLGVIISFRIFQPYAFNSLFHLSPHWLDNISEAHKMITGEIDYPPNVQWSYTKPLIHPFINIFLWGFGPTVTILSLLGIVYSLLKRETHLGKILILLVFSGIIFIYQGVQLAKYMRYFYPIYPTLAILAGLAAFRIVTILAVKTKIPKLLISVIIIGAVFFWPISFLSIYSRPHSRVTASEWIYENIPSGSKLTSEEWDDGLPLIIPGYQRIYTNIPLGLYNSETEGKWKKIIEQINEADYIIISSNRLSGSIPNLSRRYPVTSLYYQFLFEERLGFDKVAEITSYPCFLSKRVVDDKAEESFTVYDHPKIIIFKKSEDYHPDMFIPLLDQRLIQKTEYVNPKETNRLF